MLMASNNLTQTTPDTVAHDRATESFRGHETGTKGDAFLAPEPEDSEDHERPAMGFAFVFNAEKLRRMAQSLRLREATRAAAWLIDHGFLYHELANEGALNCPPIASFVQQTSSRATPREDIVRETNPPN